MMMKSSLLISKCLLRWWWWCIMCAGRIIVQEEYRDDPIFGGFFLSCEHFGRMFGNSFPACAFFFFKWRFSWRTLIPLIRPGSVHSGSACWDDWPSISRHMYLYPWQSLVLSVFETEQWWEGGRGLGGVFTRIGEIADWLILIMKRKHTTKM